MSSYTQGFRAYLMYFFTSRTAIPSMFAHRAVLWLVTLERSKNHVWSSGFLLQNFGFLNVHGFLPSWSNDTPSARHGKIAFVSAETGFTEHPFLVLEETVVSFSLCYT